MTVANSFVKGRVEDYSIYSITLIKKIGYVTF